MAGSSESSAEKLLGYPGLQRIPNAKLELFQC
ncbi:MAG: oxygenase, partial [Sphingomonadales bacterium]